MAGRRKNLPEEVENLFVSPVVSTEDVDDCLAKYRLTNSQLEKLADAVFEKVVHNGPLLTVRRNICYTRILHGLTLKKMAMVVPVGYRRLLDIEKGYIENIRPNECRLIDELLGTQTAPEIPDILREPSGEGLLLRLKDMGDFNNFNDLERFANANGSVKFTENQLPGVSGIVIHSTADEIGLALTGEVFIQVSELISTDDIGLFLCCTANKQYRILTRDDNGTYRTADGEQFVQDIVWRLPVRRIIFDVKDRSCWL